MTAKAKADLEARKIPTFWIGGTCEVLPSDAPTVQSLGVTPRASFLVSSDSLAIPPSLVVETTDVVSQPLPPRASSLTPMTKSALELFCEPSRSKRRRSYQWRFSHVDPILPFCNANPNHKVTLIFLIGGVGVNLPEPDKLLISELLFFNWSRDAINVINTGNRIIDVYEAEVQKREEMIKTLASRSNEVATWHEAGHQMHWGDCSDTTTSENQHNLNDLFGQASALKDEKYKLVKDIKNGDDNVEAASTEVAKLQADLERSRLMEDCLRKEVDEARRRADQMVSGSSAQSVVPEEAWSGLQKPNYVKEEKEYPAQVEFFTVDSEMIPCFQLCRRLLLVLLKTLHLKS
ncbi:hypothetical protein AALP_AA4G019000 [Arabis alpina]|uniref:Uncharacterized protein n=1 Tax=Arabis alpina TaxID=50452 RepID=A0A087H0J9_ARAAL|nr:hypothetical protein AALP_AA4G019000 [Arabis alpina]